MTGLRRLVEDTVEDRLAAVRSSAEAMLGSLERSVRERLDGITALESVARDLAFTVAWIKEFEEWSGFRSSALARRNRASCTARQQLVRQ